MRQMTFDIPEEVAERFTSEVPAAEQSSVVAKLLERRLLSRKWTGEEMIAAADAANADEQLNSEIDEWQAFSDPITEPWNAPSPR